MFSTNIMRFLRAEVNEKRKIRIEYTPDQSYVLFDTHNAFTNYRQGLIIQGFNTNQNLDWYIVECFWKPYLISVGMFDYFGMSGSKGTKKQRKLIKKYNRTLYSCRSLGAKGEVMTVKCYLQMPEWWKRYIGKCHVASDTDDEQLFCADNGVISKISEDIVILKVPIFVKLPKNISVTIGKDCNGEIIRKLTKPKHKWKIFKRKAKS